MHSEKERDNTRNAVHSLLFLWEAQERNVTCSHLLANMGMMDLTKH